MNDLVTSKLDVALSKHNARLDENRRASDLADKLQRDLDAAFDRIRDGIIVPTLNEVAKAARAKGFNFQVEEKDSEVRASIQDRHGALRLQGGVEPILVFRYTDGAVTVSRAGGLGEAEELPFADITPELIDHQAVNFILMVLDAVAERSETE